MENNSNEESKESLQNNNQEISSGQINLSSNQDDKYNLQIEPIEEDEDYSCLSIEDLIKETESIVNSKNIVSQTKKISKIKTAFNFVYQCEFENKKKLFISNGGIEEDFKYYSPLKSRFDVLMSVFKEKQNEYHKELEQEYAENLKKRREIIENLKNLYTNSEIGTNLFKEIRNIKDEWNKTGMVAKSEFKTLNNDYFHHLNQFYKVLDLNKEYREQEYAHNLEKRNSIISRAKELLQEPVIQKAMNELQHLHKVWREEAVLVAEEFRESTWEEFKKISDLVHQRKIELSLKIESEKNQNLEKKIEIIEEIKKLSNPKSNTGHSYWQTSIKRVDTLRNQFIEIGRVPIKFSAKNWNEFKETIHKFNSAKNNFYRELKKSQHENLDKKLKLIEIAKENKDSNDWDIALPLFKKLQQDWKNIGSISKDQSDKIWIEFKNLCNHFFERFKSINGNMDDDWEKNYEKKKNLLDKLKQIDKSENSSEIINKIKNEWDNIGKVPHNKININNEFNKFLREKMKIHKMKNYDIYDENISDANFTEKVRQIKKHISELESEVIKLQNNLSFFNNPTRDNPLLETTFNNLDTKSDELSQLKTKLHNMISSRERQNLQENSDKQN